jgi:hypothetical protein
MRRILGQLSKAGLVVSERRKGGGSKLAKGPAGNELDAESALADSDTALRRDLVNIYTASGGGWKV